MIMEIPQGACEHAVGAVADHEGGKAEFQVTDVGLRSVTDMSIWAEGARHILPCGMIRSEDHGVRFRQAGLRVPAGQTWPGGYKLALSPRLGLTTRWS